MKGKIAGIFALAVLGFSAHTANADTICSGCEHINATDVPGTVATYIGTYNPNNFDNGTFTNTNIALEEGLNTPFTNYWVFDIQPSNARGSISANFTSEGPVLDFQGGLYSAADPTTCASAPTAPTACTAATLGGQIGVTQTGNNWEIVAVNLAPGRYIIRIDGTTPEVRPSAYSANIAFRPVPEPASLALLGLGLLGVGVRMRRRSR